MLKKILIGIICLFSTLQVLADDFENYFINGYKDFNNQNYQSAINNFENAMKLNNKFYDVYCYLGMSYGIAGYGDKAEETFKIAIKKFPDEWRAYTFLGDMKNAQHLTPSAIDYYEKAISLPSMPEDGKVYYKNLIKTIIKEQQEYEKNIKDNIKTDISINLDMKKWNIAYLKGDRDKWLLEYGLKNEDVINYKWTKLVTINFFSKEKYNFELKQYYNEFISLLRQQAENTNRTLNLSILNETENEIYFVWSISERNECEICRIFKNPKGLYFVHYAEKKNNFTKDEKDKIIEILKSVKVNEQ